ncbi:hypothetical protein [Calothrix sp. 336/3]|uniref:hypothetical protein n=1 Tax=Calothrix sp. 336/3 TaxID=1337936 RepID=UPI0004E2C6E4|nr:hypothetical protein [Calothrix sp. 336/3]AKG21915.1 hypothetical protein IJ00_12185 [Calothrix sp. 336/3]
MTQSVTDILPVPEKVWRRHTDPPGLWVFLATGSIALHLLLFWLLRFSDGGLLNQRRSPRIASVSLINITPTKSQKKTSLTAKSSRNNKNKTSPQPQVVTPKKNTATPQQNPTAPIISPEVEPPLEAEIFPTDAERQAIQRQQRRQRRNRRQTPQPVVTPPPEDFTDSFDDTNNNRNRDIFPQDEQTVTPSPESTPENTPEPNNTNFPDESQEVPPETNTGEIIADKPTNQEGETPRTDRTETPTTDSDNFNKPLPDTLPTDDSGNQPQPENTSPADNQGENTPPGDTPTEKPQPENTSPPETPTEKPPGGIIATWTLLSAARQREMMTVSPPDPDLVLPEYTGNPEKKITSLLINQGLDLKPITFLASVFVDTQGNVVQAIVIDSNIPASERDKYAQFATEVFRDEKFQPAYFPPGAKGAEGTKLDLTERYVQITIRRE